MEFIYDELKQHIVRKVDDLTNKKLKYLLVLYKNNKNIYSLVYLKNSNTIDIINKNTISYISPLSKLKVKQSIPKIEIYELEYNFDLDKFIEVQNHIIKQINHMNEQLYNYVNPDIYYMLSTCNFIHSHGTMSLRSAI
jgi:hypothetical protein